MASGQMTLAQLRAAARSASDTEGDPHITDAELTGWINSSLYELYDLLISRYGEHYYVASADITADGSSDRYPLPDGTLYDGAQPYYKGELVEWQYGTGPYGWVTLPRFNLREKNRWNTPPYVGVGQGSALGRTNVRYCLLGSDLLLNPMPAAGQMIRLWYAPRLTELVDDEDVADGVSGWLEYVVVDAALKAVRKQERDPQILMIQKAGLKERIEAAATNRDMGEPATVSETESDVGIGGPFGGWVR